MGFDVLDKFGALKVVSPLGSFTVTTTGNIDDLDFNNAALIRMNNATLSTIRGLKAGVDGQEVTIASIGAGNVEFAHQNASSGAANRLINFVSSANTPLFAAQGNATYKYDLTTARWRLVSHFQGSGITPAYAAGNFTASGAMTWTVDAGDVTVCNYKLIGNLLYFTIAISTSSVGGVASNFLQVLNGAWGGFTAAFGDRELCIVSPAGADQLGSVQTTGGSGTLFFSPGVPPVLWTVPTVNTTYITAEIFFQVN